MPKKQKLKETLEMKAPGSSKFKEYEFRLEWEDRKLYYGKGVFPKSIDFAKTRSWDVSQEKRRPAKMDRRREEEKRIISLKVWSQRKKKAIEGQLKIPSPQFDTWLYWLLASIYKHADLSIIEEKMDGSGLKPSRKRKISKISARRGMKAFDDLHRVFITTSERIEKWKKLKTKGKKKTRRRNGIEFVGEGGVEFGEMMAYLGSGAGGEIFRLNRLHSQPGTNPVPAIVKTTPIPNSGSGEKEMLLGKVKDIIKEFRTIAALGEHPNIIRIIDALTTKEKIYAFMELGGPNLKKYVENLKKSRKRLSAYQINTIALGIFSGLSHMHQRGFYHFDFKPGNVLIFEGYRPKIIDFGNVKTKLFEPGKEIYTYSNEGSDGYRPPECAMHENWGSVFSKRIHLEQFDSYSAGRTIFRELIAPWYGWNGPVYKAPTKRQVIKEIEYWAKKYDTNRKRLDKDGLLMISHVAWMMIQKDRLHRVTVRSVFETFKNLCKESNSGRRALITFKEWGDKKHTYIQQI